MGGNLTTSLPASVTCHQRTSDVQNNTRDGSVDSHTSDLPLTKVSCCISRGDRPVTLSTTENESDVDDQVFMMALDGTELSLVSCVSVGRDSGSHSLSAGNQRRHTSVHSFGSRGRPDSGRKVDLHEMARCASARDATHGDGQTLFGDNVVFPTSFISSSVDGAAGNFEESNLLSLSHGLLGDEDNTLTCGQLDACVPVELHDVQPGCEDGAGLSGSNTTFEHLTYNDNINKRRRR